MSSDVFTVEHEPLTSQYVAIEGVLELLDELELLVELMTVYVPLTE